MNISVSPKDQSFTIVGDGKLSEGIDYKKNI